MSLAVYQQLKISSKGKSNRAKQRKRFMNAEEKKQRKRKKKQLKIP